MPTLRNITMLSKRHLFPRIFLGFLIFNSIGKGRCQFETRGDLIFVTDYGSSKIYASTLSASGPTSLSPVNVTPVTETISPVAIAYDPEQDYIFWTDTVSKSIHRARYEGTDHVTIIADIQSLGGMAIDLASRRIFWTDYYSDRIEVAYLNGTGRSLVVSDGLSQPDAIVADSLHGLFWIDKEPNNAKIERANMDGSNRRTVIGTSLNNPNGISIDPVGNTLYWCDTELAQLETSDLDGNSREMLLQGPSVGYPLDVAVHAEYLYWTDYYYGRLKRINRNMSLGTMEQVGPDIFEGALGLHIYVDECSSSHCIYNEVDKCSSSPCLNNGTCMDIINSFQCNCAEGFAGTLCEEDMEDPIVTCPSNLPWFQTDSRSATAIVTWVTHVEDNSGQFEVESTYSPGYAFPIGVTTVVYNAQDYSENTAGCSFNVTVKDTEKPNLVCPDNVVSAIDKRVIWNSPEPDDNSGLNVTLTASDSPDDAWEVGVYSVTYTATDVYGNVDTCSFNVSVIDACSDKKCLNDGICQADNEESECICPSFYSGEFCENKPDPPAFSVFPTSTKADLYDKVNLTCTVTFSSDWQWYKDDVPLVSTHNIYLITVTMTIENQGYYTCSGYGAGPHSDRQYHSNKVPLTVNGISIIPASLTFNHEFDKNLNDPTSPAFKELSINISDFLSQDMSLNDDVTIQIRRFSAGSVITDVNFYVLLNTNTAYDDFSATLTQELIRIGNNSDGFLISDSIVISSTESCYKEVYDEIYTFPSASVGDTVQSEETCDDIKVNYLLPLANRTCNGDGFSAAKWDNYTIANCGPDATAEQLLERLTMIEVTVDNVEEVSSEVENITSNAEEITVDALEATADILQEILNAESNSTEVTDSVVSVVDNLFSVNEDVLKQSQLEDQAPTAIVDVLEQQLNQVELDDSGVYKENTPNLAVHAQKVDVRQENFKTYLSFFSESSETGVGNVDVIKDSMEIPDAANVSIALPASISNVFMENNMTDFRIVVIVYNDSRLFQSSQFINDSSGRRPNSQVISLSVPDLDRVELDEPIIITFIPIEVSETNRNTTCVFWDFKLHGTGGWSSNGCTFVNGSADGSDRQYCQCTHLTNFAILMDFHNNTAALSPAADIVTTVGLSISIVCLCLTILTCVTNKKLRRRKPRIIQCQLCLSLLGLYIVFLTGIDQTHRSRGCIVAGAFLHYFLLSSIFWMSVQAVNMYYLFVKVFDAQVEHFLLKACLYAWGLPVVIVLVSAFIDIDSYVNSITHCFLTLQRMYYGVAIPVALSLLFNLIIFIMVLQSLYKLRKKINTSHTKGKKKKGMQMLQNGVSITVILGLTWLVGFFAIGDASQVMAWLFCILNSFQGFLIFILFCVRNKEVRTHWCELLRNLPENINCFQSVPTSKSGRSRLLSRFSKNLSSGKPKRRSSSNSASYPSQSMNTLSESSQARLGKHSITLDTSC